MLWLVFPTDKMVAAQLFETDRLFEVKGTREIDYMGVKKLVLVLELVDEVKNRAEGFRTWVTLFPSQVLPISACCQIPIDSHPHTSDNDSMSTDTPTTSKNELEDLIAKPMKGEQAPEAAKKSRERMDRMREETRKRVGTVEVAVKYIREHRDR